ncbi:MAG: hypothetical protein A2087_13755 [Spirochaetes bacterium GWD1_61_31]|nr:MAG: hypothetical protein A2Y37_13025 [Spirochaetes bacterium GWB1_60_80]OHD42294.1 MAG: hypothetical protein A2087_13755 [Spirochaetes bacterium GWD1_61_31]HAP44474.1 hypothetical protein [Spirochaetaceae bacterium]HAW86604.1 hypothetical protein [Spirochaetaceae bacterium]HAX36406.1 hypothetical protein [Spirochaetaceae bacterium]
MKHLLLVSGLVLAASLLNAQIAPDPDMAEAEANLVPQSFYVTVSEDSAEREALAILAEYLKLAIISHSRTTPAATLEAAEVQVFLSAEARGGNQVLRVLVFQEGNPTARLDRTAAVNGLEAGGNLDFLAELAKALDRSFPPQPPRVVEVVTERVVEETEVVTIVRGVVLSIDAPPGTRLTSRGQPDQIAVADQTQSYELPANSTFTFTASRHGYMPVEHTVFVGNQDLAETVTLEALPTLELVPTLHYLNLVPGIGLNWYFWPGYAYAGASLESSFLALVPIVDDSGFLTIHYLELEIRGGLHFGSPADWLRFGLQLAAAGRLEIGNGRIGLADWGAFSVAGAPEVEVRLGPGWSLFLAAKTRLLLVSSPYGNTWDPTGTTPLLIPFLSDSGDLGFWLSPIWFIQNLEMMLGARIEL